MSHFAKIVDGKVVQVIVADEEFFKTFDKSSASSSVNPPLITERPLGISFCTFGDE